jgi:hypothetical protein
LDNGWVIQKENFVSSSPNSESVEDTSKYLIRYKYIKNPEAPGASVKETTRDFCRVLLNKNFVYRVEDLLNIINDEGKNAADWRGGYNCRHIWQQITYYNDGNKIVNKGSVTKNRVDGMESLDVFGDPQNDTRTSNPSFSKEKFESYSDYPESVKNNAKAVLKYVEENGWGSCGTSVGKIRANQLANGEPISEDTIKRMYSYLSRHAGDLDSSKGYGDGCGKLMYDSWGGKSALSWAESKVKQFGYDNNLPSYVDELPKKKKDQKFAVIEDGNFKKIVLGPAMIPDQRIFRTDDLGNPYYVFFSPSTIRMIAEKYMRNKYTDNNDLMHDGQAVKDIHVLESWIVEDPEHDKAKNYGFDVPAGTWMISMKVNNPKVWEQIKEKKLNGFSVSGFFEEVAAFCREEMFLKQVVEILKNIED